jgi:hemolysin D
MFTPVFKELLTKYLTVFSAVWAVRHKLNPIARNSNELAFLPAALELQENPPHSAARITLWVLLAFILIAVNGACFRKCAGEVSNN